MTLLLHAIGIVLSLYGGFTILALIANWHFVQAGIYTLKPMGTIALLGTLTYIIWLILLFAV